jgi:type IV pilus assembly protein PilY1
LGDFIGSGPELASNENYGYDLLPGSEGISYSTFLTSKASRTPMIYVGGNDGMLHGFTAGTSGGTETFAYIPRTVYYAVEGGSATINDYTSPSYNHRYFVDGPLRVFDAYLDNAWKSLLLGTTGAGGRAIFAIDVSNPGQLGASSIKWEISAVSDTELPDLGFTFGQPLLVRTRSVTYPWVVIAANGYNSPSGIAKLMVIDPSTGSIIKWIDTKAGPNLATGGSVSKNGLSSPIAVDIDQDRIVDYVYAGDLEGNVWKFDFTSANDSNWGVAYGTASKPTPLFVACAVHTSSCSDANRQPITAKPQVAAAPLNQGGMMIYFGTGRYLEDSDKIIANNEQVQTFYGVWDKNLGTNDDVITSNANLVAQTTTTSSLSQGSSTLRLTSSNTVDYKTKNGWYLDLGGNASGERVISAANYHDGRITFASFAPSTTPCVPGGTGWIMELDAQEGKRIQGVLPVFDINNDGTLDSKDFVGQSSSGGSPSGMAVEGVPSATRIMRDSNYVYRINSLSSGTISVNKGRADPNRNSRVSWRQIR